MKRFILTLFCFAFLGAFVCAEIQFPHSLNLVTDMAYYPYSDWKVGEPDTHFAPITGAYSALEARATLNYTYTIKCPFADNPFVRGNTLKFTGSLEVSPVTLMPMFQVQFTPIAFLVFSAGTKVGTGWTVPGLAQGLAQYNDITDEYDDMTPFKDWYLSAWFEGLFQFDVGALWPGDWHHIVTQASYRITYNRNTGVDNGDVWLWQTVKEYANGPMYLGTLLLGYQMPLVLQTVALQAEFEGYFNADTFAQRYAAWNPKFQKINISPVAILKFNDHHQLTAQFRFRSRRSYLAGVKYQDNGKVNSADVMDLLYSSREWYFDRLAFSYKYTF